MEDNVNHHWVKYSWLIHTFPPNLTQSSIFRRWGISEVSTRLKVKELWVWTMLGAQRELSVRDCQPEYHLLSFMIPFWSRCNLMSLVFLHPLPFFNFILVTFSLWIYIELLLDILTETCLTFQIHIDSLLSRMTCGFGLYLWCVLSLHIVCLLPLLSHCLARSSLPFLTSFKLPISLPLAPPVFFPSTLPLSFCISLNPLFDPWSTC